MMLDNDYTKRLENVVKQMLEPIKDVPFNLVVETLSVDVKHEFNSDNRRLYSGKDGALLLREGEV